MADISLVTADKVNVGTLTVQQHTCPAGEAITAGAPVYIKATDGKFYNSDANGSNMGYAWGVGTRTVAAGEALTAVRRGPVDGYDLSALNFGQAVFVSNTVGRLADAAGTSSVQVGTVLPVWGQPNGSTPDKVLLVECV